jgi:hypothetical protein
MWELREEDDEELLEAPFKTLSWPKESLVSSIWLASQILEEIEAFVPWQQDTISISSLALVMKFIHDMQGLSTKTYKVLLVLEVYKSKDEALQ